MRHQRGVAPDDNSACHRERYICAGWQAGREKGGSSARKESKINLRVPQCSSSEQPRRATAAATACCCCWRSVVGVGLTGPHQHNLQAGSRTHAANALTVSVSSSTFLPRACFVETKEPRQAWQAGSCSATSGLQALGGPHLLRYGCLHIEVQEAVLPGAPILVHVCRRGEGRGAQGRQVALVCMAAAAVNSRPGK